uniref:Putative plant transposon protein domain-containing protein n=1 Tax=Solanum tuberosum TaxID=4113 RepID=M1E0R7_SOLTU
MARDPGTYSEEMVREFYASYAATLRGSITKRSKPLAQDPLTSTMVRGCPVDISPATISRFLYGPTTGHSWSLNTSEFDYRWDIVRSGAFQSNAEQREAHRQEKEARRAWIVDEELRQHRARERVARASSSALVVEVQLVLKAVVSTTDGAERLIESTNEGATIADVGITECASTIVLAGSGKPDPPAC